MLIITSFHSGLHGWWNELMSGVRNLRDEQVKIGGWAIFQTSFPANSFTVASNNAGPQLSHHISYLSKAPFLMNRRQSPLSSKHRSNRQTRWWTLWPGHHRHWLAKGPGHLCSRIGQISLQQLGAHNKLGCNHLSHLEKFPMN